MLRVLWGKGLLLRSSRESPVRVLFLCNSPAVPAGVEKTVLLLLEHIDRERFSPRVILNGEGPFADALRQQNEDVEIIPCRGRISGKWLKELRESLQRRPADVVQLHLSRLNARHLRKWGCKVVERLNMTRHSSFMYPMRWRPIDLWTSRWIDHFVVVSESLRQQFVKRGYPDEKLSVIHNGVQIPQNVTQQALRKELGLTSEAKIVGAVGRLTEQKGIDTFILAAKIVATRIQNAHFVIAGDGELRNRLEDLAVASGVGGRIHFLGFRRDVVNIIASLDILVYLSRWEPFSNTILEAMATGTPVVASEVGGNAEIINDGENGILVPPDDPQRAANAVLRLLDNKDSAAAITTMAKATACTLSPGKMTRNHEEIYVKLLT